MKKIGVLFIIISICMNAVAVDDEYNFQNITTSDGLPNNTILCIAQDSIGRMWFGTYDGLCVYNGVDYKSFHYDATNPEISLGDNQITNLKVDYKGSVWVQLANGSISRLLNVEKGYFKNYSFKGSVKIEVTEKGRILVLSAEGVKTFDYENDTFVNHRKISHSKKENNYREHLKKLYPQIEIICYFQVNKNEAWVSSRYHGIFHIKEKTTKEVSTVNVTHDNNNHFSIASDEAYAVFVDRTGILWVGTKDRGISKLLPQISQIATLSFKEGNSHQLPESPIRAISKDGKNNLWIGTYDKGVFVYTESTNTYHPVARNRLLNDDWDRIRSIYKTSDNSMWIGSYGGLFRIDTLGNTVYYDGCILGNHKVRRIYSMIEDNEGYLWVGSWDGVDRINIKTGIVEHVLSEELSDLHVRNLYLDKNSVLWIATEFGGVNKYNLKTKVVEILKNTDDNSPLNCNSTFHITQSKQGEYWISTFSGITVYNAVKNTYTKLHLELPSDLVYGVLQDKNGVFWVNTSNGVVRFNQQLTQSRVFDDKDGWISSQMCEGGFYMSEQNELYFGGNGGVNYFKPEGFIGNDISPQGYLCCYHQKTDQPRNTPKELNLNYFNEGLNLTLYAYHYLEPSKNKIAYRVWPKDTAWHVSLGSKVRIQEETLESGNYQLEYRMANADGKWSEIYTYRISVNKPFWSTALFWGIALVLVLAVVVISLRFKVHLERKKSKDLELLVKKRTQQLEEHKTKLEEKNAELAASNKSVSEQKDKVTHQHDALLQLHEQLKVANEMKMQFFSNLAHEFRTPLTLIAGPVEFLLDSGSLKNEADRKKLNLVKQQTDVLTKLVNQLLDFKKLEGGYMELEKENGELIPFCNNIIGGFEFEAEAKNINLNFSCDYQVLNCSFDAEKLRQILINLISNAFKFTPEKGKVDFSLDLDEAEENIVFKVADNGIGISIEHVNNIFNRFYQAGKSLDLTKPGTGLGLSLSKKLAELHGGDILVESEEGRGSCFTVTLPYEPYEYPSQSVVTQIESAAIEHEEQVQKLEEYEHPKESQKSTILVVDDHPDIVEHIESILKVKYHILKAANGVEALKIIKHTQVDVILSDWLMPQMNGISFCSKVKENKSWQKIPIILITALNSSSNQIKALQFGADDFISKPFSNQLLVAKIENLLKREKALLQSKAIANHLQPQNKKEQSQEEITAQKLGQLVNDNLGDPEFTPESLGDKMGWSKMQLYRKVKQATGLTPNELIQTARLQRGRQLLEDKGFRVSEVCFMVGFNDPKYFSRCFHKAFDIKPSEFLEQKRKEKDQAEC